MKELTTVATGENIAVVTAFVDEQPEALDCPMKAQMQNAIAVDYLEKGKIVDDGTYDELIALGRKFAELVESQRLDA